MPRGRAGRCAARVEDPRTPIGTDTCRRMRPWPTPARPSMKRCITFVLPLAMLLTTAPAGMAVAQSDEAEATSSPSPTEDPSQGPPTASPSLLSPSANAGEPPSPSRVVHRPTIASDRTDYAPGDTVTLSGSDWQPNEAVRVIVDDTRARRWSYTTDVDAGGDGSFTISFMLPNWFVAVYHASAKGGESGTATTTFTDSAGSYSLKWFAADPGVRHAPYLPTYRKVPPSAAACPVPSGGSGRASDPMPNAVLGNPRDAVTSLAPRDLALGQIVPFEAEIKVKGSTSPENGKIQLVGR